MTMNKGDSKKVAIHLTLTPTEFHVLYEALAAATEGRYIEDCRHEADALGRKLFGDDYPAWKYIS